MKTLLPVLSVLLALVAAGSIAYIAWDLTSERTLGKRDPRRGEENENENENDD